jgi:hypothetical protein
MSGKTLRIALASLAHPRTIVAGLEKIEAALKYAASRRAGSFAFPKSTSQGCAGRICPCLPPDRKVQEHALRTVRGLAREHGLAADVGIEDALPWTD